MDDNMTSLSLHELWNRLKPETRRDITEVMADVINSHTHVTDNTVPTVPIAIAIVAQIDRELHT